MILTCLSSDEKNSSINAFLKSGKPSSHLQAGLGKAVSWMFEVFSEHIGIWGFSEPGDDSPFLLDGVRGRESLWTCPCVLLQLWGRGEDLEGLSGSHIKIGLSPWWTVGPLCALGGSFLPHCICRASWVNATLCWQQRSTPPSLEIQFSGCPWATIWGCELPTWSAGMTAQVRQQLYPAAEPELPWLQGINPWQRKRVACRWLFTTCGRTGGLLTGRRTSALPPQRLESRKWLFLIIIL